ncbi:hypothetical protein SISNIDRAFT_468040 [Sistotremastrum niveocremeum HHB9708]|uniref:F-box domain-containing protein n=1 Tax=Sistotremastrum niveocremeum HHB9708 TaxID=1314777 RepID=A0A164S3D3_9AGAM|nr:hypothetical protein SISNIDRAFT_468040 [Sistotremastrum niveocremeum HHB9708]
MPRPIPLEIYRNIAHSLYVDHAKGDLVNLSCTSSAWQAEAEHFLWRDFSLHLPLGPDIVPLPLVRHRFAKYIRSLFFFLWRDDTNTFDSDEDEDESDKLSRMNKDYRLEMTGFLREIGPRIRELTILSRGNVSFATIDDILSTLSVPKMTQFNVLFDSYRDSPWLSETLPPFLKRHSIKELTLYASNTDDIIRALHEDSNVLQGLEVLRTGAEAVYFSPHLPQVRELIVQTDFRLAVPIAPLGPSWAPNLKVLYLPLGGEDRTSRLIANLDSIPLVEELYNYRFGSEMVHTCIISIIRLF